MEKKFVEIFSDLISYLFQIIIELLKLHQKKEKRNASAGCIGRLRPNVCAGLNVSCFLLSFQNVQNCSLLKQS